MIRHYRDGTLRSNSIGLAAGIAFLIAALSSASLAAAKDQEAMRAPAATPEGERHPSELALEGMAKMMQALDKLIQAVPQYEMPTITENGDIILRRKNPSPPDAKQKQPSLNDRAEPI
jgi:hypothetical protein